MGECEVTELYNGSLLLNSRSFGNARVQSLSDDGGGTWHSPYYNQALVEPDKGCQASIRRFSWPKPGQSGVLLFSNPASTTVRQRLTLRASFDEGLTWPWKTVLARGSSAYSCLVVMPDGSLVVLYEADDYSDIRAIRMEAEALPEARQISA